MYQENQHVLVLQIFRMMFLQVTLVARRRLDIEFRDVSTSFNT